MKQIKNNFIFFGAVHQDFVFELKNELIKYRTNPIKHSESYGGVAHNVAKIEEYKIDGKLRKVYVHRKGATRAFGPGHKELPSVYRKVGQPIILPGSMGTASYVLVGTDKAMNETFSSTPHGAGRMMSRHEANKRFTTENVIENLEKHKIYIKAASRRGITEEAPGAYKDVDEVIEVADKIGIGKKVARLVPMGVMKG